MLGADVTDTIDAQPLQALVVEVRGLEGKLASGAIVRFEAQPPADTSRRYEPAIYVCALTAPTCGLGGGYGYTAFTVDTADAKGQAKAIVRLGRVAGRAVVRLSVPELGLVDSATFTVTPGAPAKVLALAADTALDVGATAKLSGRVVDRYGNLRPEVPTLSAGAGTAVTVDGATGIVTGRDMGTQWVFARYAALADSTSVRVVPTGRLVVWDAWQQVVRLVNLNGSDVSTIVSQVHSDLGVFPRFDATRRHVTLHTGDVSHGGQPSTVVVVDTTGVSRRDIGPASGFTTIVAVRQLADGTLLVVGRRDVDASSTVNGLWLVDAGNTVTLLAALPGMALSYGGADVSHDGTRVAYLADGPSLTFELRVLTVSSGAITVLEPNARSPRWSSQGDRVAYLVPSGVFSGDNHGVAVVTNADGTGRRDLGSAEFSPGLAWSPDGKYLVGRSSRYFYPYLRLLRVSDGASVELRFISPERHYEDYYQPDWR